MYICELIIYLIYLLASSMFLVGNTFGIKRLQTDTFFAIHNKWGQSIVCFVMSIFVGLQLVRWLVGPNPTIIWSLS